MSGLRTHIVVTRRASRTVIRLRSAVLPVLIGFVRRVLSIDHAGEDPELNKPDALAKTATLGKLERVSLDSI